VKVRVKVRVRVQVRVRVRVQVRGHPLRERARRVLVHEVELDTFGRARFRASARVRPRSRPGYESGPVRASGGSLAPSG